MISLICCKADSYLLKKGRIDTKDRPGEVATWLKNGRKYGFTPTITNPTKYKVSWQKWWQGLQPKWHQLDDGTLLQEVPEMGEQWESLQRGGTNGFFMIVLALSWWVGAMGGIVDDLGLLDDVTWVVRCMTDTPAMPSQSIGRKRTLENEPDTSIRKWDIPSFSMTY